MTTSIDGKVAGAFLFREECAPAIEEYYRLNREIPAEAFACGRVTMEESFTGGWYPDLSGFTNKKINREDYIANQDATRYAIAFDRKGKLGWKSSVIEDEDPGYGGAHIVEVLCEDVDDAYLSYLQSIGVSYIFAGKSEMDLEMALEKLWSNFFINDLLLEGGSEINSAFELAGLIDELSLVQTSVIADTERKPLFQQNNLGDYILKEAKVVSDSVLCLRYLQKNNRTCRVIRKYSPNCIVQFKVVVLSEDLKIRFVTKELSSNAMIFRIMHTENSYFDGARKIIYDVRLMSRFCKKGEDNVIPVIDKKKTGIHLRRIMDECGLSVKDVQQYLGLGSVQSVYHWLNGLSMPTIDNLYALSELFQMPVDDMLRGNRRYSSNLINRQNTQIKRLCAYYERINEHTAA